MTNRLPSPPPHRGTVPSRGLHEPWRQAAELSQRVAFLAWLDCADGATRRQIAAEMADHPQDRSAPGDSLARDSRG